MNLIEACKEMVEKGGEYFYRESYDCYLYKFEKLNECLIQKHENLEWSGDDIALNIADIFATDWQVHYAEPKLKPCAHCNKSDLVLTHTGHYVSDIVKCMQCGATGPCCNSRKEAITAWNRREGEEK